MRRRAWLRGLPLLLAGLAAGCAGYRLGPPSGIVPGSKTLQVLPFQNLTTEPRLVEPLVRALRRQFQQEGTFRLATHGAAEVAVSGEILRYERRPVSYQPRDVLTTRDYELHLTARVRAVDRATGRTHLDREIRGRTTLRAGADPTSAERQALPLAADDLARQAVALIADGEW